jgi:hypothetical protein
MQRFLFAWLAFVALGQHEDADINLKLSQLLDQYDSPTTDPELILADLSESNRIVSSEFTDLADNSMFVTAARMMFRKGLEMQLRTQANQMESAVRASIERASKDAVERMELESALAQEVAAAFTDIASTLDKR